MATSGSKVPSASLKVVSASVKVVSARVKVVSARVKVVSARVKVLSASVKDVSARLKILSSTLKVPSASVNVDDLGPTLPRTTRNRNEILETRVRGGVIRRHIIKSAFTLAGLVMFFGFYIGGKTDNIDVHLRSFLWAGRFGTAAAGGKDDVRRR
mgnify:FL=1